MAGLLTATERASMRADAAATLADTCSVKGWTTERNARGNVINRTEEVRAASVACRIRRNPIPVFGAESGGAYGRQAETIDTTALAFQGWLPHGTDVRESDHLVMASGTRYEVTSVDDEASEAATVMVGLVKLGIDNPDA